jgi:hypothetical protein
VAGSGAEVRGSDCDASASTRPEIGGRCIFHSNVGCDSEAVSDSASLEEDDSEVEGSHAGLGGRRGLGLNGILAAGADTGGDAGARAADVGKDARAGADAAEVAVSTEDALLAAVTCAGLDADTEDAAVAEPDNNCAGGVTSSTGAGRTGTALLLGRWPGRGAAVAAEGCARAAAGAEAV